MKVHYPKLYNMANLLASNVLLLPKDLTIIFIYILYYTLFKFLPGASSQFCALVSSFTVI